MKIKFFIFFIVMLFYGCKERIDIYYQKDKSILYNIEYENLKGKVLNINDNQYELYGYVTIASNNKEIYKGNLFIDNSFLQSKNILKNDVYLSCNDGYMFNDVNYLNKINLNCVLYTKTNNNNVSLKNIFNNFENNTMIKFKVLNN